MGKGPIIRGKVSDKLEKFPMFLDCSVMDQPPGSVFLQVVSCSRFGSVPTVGAGGYRRPVGRPGGWR